MTSAREFKHDVYAQLSRIGKAVASPQRIELLDLLCQGPRTVELLAEQASLSVANASSHLQVLRAARLVETEKKGLYVEYRLASDDVGGFYVALRGLAESRLAEIEQAKRDFFQTLDDLEALEPKELIRRVRNGEATVLDVRPLHEFRAGHIPGALCIPVAELKARLAELPKSRPVIAYCRGPYCVMAVDAVRLLRKKGFEAHRLEQGVTDWRARGWRIATETAATKA